MGRLTDALKGVKIPDGAKALVAEADKLLDQRHNEAGYVQHLEEEIKRLREERGIPTVIGNLVFNDATGTYVDPPSPTRYCAKCLASNKRSPLRNGERGWTCMVCGKFYSDPARQPPSPRQPGGGTDWTAF